MRFQLADLGSYITQAAENKIGVLDVARGSTRRSRGQTSPALAGLRSCVGTTDLLPTDSGAAESLSRDIAMFRAAHRLQYARTMTTKLTQQQLETVIGGGQPVTRPITTEDKSQQRAMSDQINRSLDSLGARTVACEGTAGSLSAR